MRAQEQRRADWSSEEALANFLAKAKSVLQRHGRPLLIVAVALLVVLLGYRGYRDTARREQAESWEALAALPPVQHTFLEPEGADRLLSETIQGCNDILERRWKSDATPWVLLKLAGAQRAAGSREDALETYRRLGKEYPSHCARTIAAPGLAALLEEMTRFEEAACAYEALAREEGGDPSFWTDAGRGWELAGNREAAVRAYEVVADKEEFALAASRLRSLTAGGPLLAPLPPAPSPVEERREESAEPTLEPAEGTEEGLPAAP